MEAKERERTGDGQAVFLSDMSEEEYQDFKREEIDGWKPFLHKIFHPNDTPTNN